MDDDFGAQTRLALDQMMGATKRQVRATIYQVVRNVIRSTPVGNPQLWRDPDGAPPGYTGGALRGAWQASIGAPEYVINRPIDKNGSRTVADANRKIMSLEMGQTFYLANALPYARRVEFGWSRQAPQGMLRRAVIEANRAIARL